MDNEWNKQLRERFSDYSVPEPDGLWEGIEQGLSGKTRRKTAPVWWLSGGLAAAAAAALLLTLPHSGRQLSEPMLKEDAVAFVEPEMKPENTDSLETVLVSLAENSIVSKTVAKNTVSKIPVNEEMADQVGHDVQTESYEGVEVPQKNADQVGHDGEVDNWEIQEKQEEARGISIGLYREGGPGAEEQSQAYGMARTGEYLTRASSDGNEEGSSLVRMLSANRASTYEARHRAPVRVGVKLAWQMSEHLSLVSGLNWTSLQSEFEESTASTRTLVRQDLGYLGIPLQLEASFNPWNRLWLHAGAGGMVEKGLLATSKTYSYIGSHLEDQLTGRPETGGLLWSIGASAGAEYRFSRHVGVYFAPGLEYHFDNGAVVQSAYTEHPLHWNLALGVRLNFGNH